MLNRVVLVGRLTRDPDLRYTASGVAVANFTVATNRPYRNQQGEQEADFINCVAWRKQAENLAHYMKKGSLVGVDGRIQTRSYEDKDGKMVYVTEVLAESVQFLEPRGATQQRSTDVYASDPFQHQQAPPPPPQAGEQIDSPFQSDGEQIDISDDDLPF